MFLYHNISTKLLRLISKRNPPQPPTKASYDLEFKKGIVSCDEFFRKLDGYADFEDKTVLDMGCGFGSMVYYIASKGAKEVVGVEINKRLLDYAESKKKDYPDLEGKITFVLADNAFDQKFDIVLSKNCFEHYSNPEKFTSLLKNYLKPNGKMIVGFSPLWKSPFGGHLWEFTSWPWVHIVFPEKVVMAELRSFFNDNNYQSYEKKGLNRMTYSRFIKILKANNLKPIYFKINTSSRIESRIVLPVFNVMRRIPGLKEYFTVNIYTILIMIE